MHVRVVIVQDLIKTKTLNKAVIIIDPKNRASRSAEWIYANPNLSAFTHNAKPSSSSND
jgi:hypothetical protein